MILYIIISLQITYLNTNYQSYWNSEVHDPASRWLCGEHRASSIEEGDNALQFRPQLQEAME